MKKIEDVKRSYRLVFNSDGDGDIVLADLKARLNYDQTTFVPGDPYQSAFLEGQRRAMLHIARMITEESKPKGN